MSFDVLYRYFDGRADRLVASCTTRESAGCVASFFSNYLGGDGPGCIVVRGVDPLSVTAPSYSIVATLQSVV